MLLFLKIYSYVGDGMSCLEKR